MTNQPYEVTSKGRVASNGYRLCDPLPKGEVLTSTTDHTQWVLNIAIGCGGFGEVYLGHKKIDSSKKEYAIKLDRYEGPLGIEVDFVKAFNTANLVKAFMHKHNLSFLGIPTFVADGQHKLEKCNYRFLVMARYGEELQKALSRIRLEVPLVCRIASRIIDALEFIHEQGFIHADIKATNILRAKVLNTQATKRAHEDNDNVLEDDEYFLIDFGLVQTFLSNGKHVSDKCDKRKANVGTREFRSRDAHRGVISRRSDIESLGYNLIVWFYGNHPWRDVMDDVVKIFQKKKKAMQNIDEFLKLSFNHRGVNIPKSLDKFFNEILKLSHNSKPDYAKFKAILNEIAKNNCTEPLSANADKNIKKKKMNEPTNTITLITSQQKDKATHTKNLNINRKVMQPNTNNACFSKVVPLDPSLPRRNQMRPAKVAALERIEVLFRKKVKNHLNTQ